MLTVEEEILMIKALEHAFLNNGYVFNEGDFEIVKKIHQLNLDDLIFSVSKCLALNHSISQIEKNNKISINILADYLKGFPVLLHKNGIEFKFDKLFIQWHKIDQERANDLQYKFLLK